MFPQCLRRLSWVLGAGARDVLLQFRHSGNIVTVVAEVRIS